MNIQEFIVDSLKGITEGITEAQKQLSSKAFINPGRLDDVDNEAAGRREKLLVANATMGRLAQIVEFDIAITVAEASTAGGGAQLKVMGIGLGAEGRKDFSSSSVSRIKFSVPVCLPYDES